MCECEKCSFCSPQSSATTWLIIYVQATLFASLAASLPLVFLATLSKQCLNQYISTDIQGTAIERSQNCSANWMESSPGSLQTALLSYAVGGSEHNGRVTTAH